MKKITITVLNAVLVLSCLSTASVATIIQEDLTVDLDAGNILGSAPNQTLQITLSTATFTINSGDTVKAKATFDNNEKLEGTFDTLSVRPEKN